jgi:ubiquinone/menaquinone biosynthesis C-methylase UbiE
MRPVSYDGRMAVAYNAGRGLLSEAEASWGDTVAPYVRVGAKVLDVGAGTGRFSDLFTTRLGARVIAAEPAPGMRAQRRSLAGTAWVGARAEALPLRNRSVDVVWLCCVIHYLDLVAAGREIARVLRPDGTALVRSVFPDRFDDLTWMCWFPAARRIDERRMPTVDQVVEAWRDAGLRLRHRHAAQHLVADNLNDLAERLSHRAISTLELISDEEFTTGLTALRTDARSAAPEPVYSTVDTLAFSANES